MHARAEHFDRADGGGGGDAGHGAGEEGCVRVRDMRVYRARGRRPQEVVAGEVDYVGGDGHDEGGAEAPP